MVPLSCSSLSLSTSVYASSIFTPMAFPFPTLKHPLLSIYSLPPCHFLPISHSKPHLSCKSSAQGVPAEILEDPKFVPIQDDDPNYGPPALLLTGFSQDEVPKVQEFLNGFDGDFMKVLLCTKEMVKGTLWDAMNATQRDLTKVMVAVGVPRICFLSGLTGEEIMMFITEFSKLDLEPAVFAALVPRNAQKTVEELMEEIMGDHERLSKAKK